MTQLVDPDQIEAKVGHARHDTRHLGRAVTAEKTVYILHPRECLKFWDDLRDCPFSRSLDHGIDIDAWQGHLDQPVRLGVQDGLLVPRELHRDCCDKDTE
jgi:hypothetical protein